MKLRSAETPGFPLCNETFSGAEIRRACLPPSPHLESLLIALDLSPFGSTLAASEILSILDWSPIYQVGGLVARSGARCRQRSRGREGEVRYAVCLG